MAQLAYRVCQVERLEAEKAISSKYHKKASYVEINEINSLSDTYSKYLEENEAIW